jgi:hypothetical protein
MVVCFIAAGVLGVLALFSARYRPMAKEAFGCVLRKATLRPCESDFEERIKSRIVAKLLVHSPPAAKFVNRNAEALAWLMILITLVSTAFFVQGLYNYIQFGNCNGPLSNEFCIFDPLGTGRHQINSIIAPGIGPTIGNGSVRLVEFGCFSCPYTKQAESTLKSLVANGNITLEFRFFPLPSHDKSRLAADAAACGLEQNKFWEYHDLLFEKTTGQFSSENFSAWAVELGLDASRFDDCMASGRGEALVKRDFDEGVKAGIYGTPTFFTANSSIVGPRPLAEYFGLVEPGSGGDVCPPPREVA